MMWSEAAVMLPKPQETQAWPGQVGATGSP